MTARHQLKCEKTGWYPGMVCLDLVPNSPRITIPVNGVRLIHVIIDDIAPPFPVSVENVYAYARTRGPKERMLLDGLADAALCVDGFILRMMEASDAGKNADQP